MRSCIKATNEMPTNIIAVTVINVIILIMLSFPIFNVILMLCATQKVALLFISQCKVKILKLCTQTIFSFYLIKGQLVDQGQSE